jgi:hypothetical protein
MSFISHALKQKSKDVSKDLLVILVLTKFVLEFILRQGGLSITLGAVLLIAGIIAIAARVSIIGPLLSTAAIVLFLLDIYQQGGPNSVILVGFLIIIAVLFFILLRVFER